MWGQSENGEAGHHQTPSLLVPWSWISQPLGLWEITVCWLSPHICSIFCLFFPDCTGSLLLCRLLSSCGQRGLLSGCSAWASHCSDSSHCGAQAPGHLPSGCCFRALGYLPSSCGARASLLHGMWNLPGPGIKPMSPTLTSEFFTTEPPGKPPNP